MLKKVLLILGVAIASLGVTGCGSTSDDYRDDMNDLYLVDSDGFSISDVHYSCVDDENNYQGSWVTRDDGRFSFFDGEVCTFDFYNFEGTLYEPIFMIDTYGYGADDIYYVCEGGDYGYTDRYGGFDYLADDSCTFYF